MGPRERKLVIHTKSPLLLSFGEDKSGPDVILSINPTILFYSPLFCIVSELNICLCFQHSDYSIKTLCAFIPFEYKVLVVMLLLLHDWCRYMPDMELGVLSDMPGIRMRASFKLSKQQVVIFVLLQFVLQHW